MVGRVDRLDRAGGFPRTALAAAGTAAVALIGGWTWAAHRQPGYNQLHDSLSSLAATTTAHRWIMTTAFVVTGLGHIVTALALPRLRWLPRAVLGAGGFALLLVAALPIPASGVSSPAHVAVSSLAIGLLACWPLFADVPDHAWVFGRRVRFAATGAMAALAVVLLGAMVSGVWWFGLAERAVASAEVAWPVVTATAAWHRERRALRPTRLRHVLALLTLTLACCAGGTAATALWPTHAQTRYYSADLTLSLNPLRTNHLQARTVLGDLDATFTGLAPGIVARPEVRAEITALLARDGVSVRTLEPSQDELSDAITRAGAVLGLKFALGSLMVAVGFVVAYDVARRRRPTVPLVAVAVTAWLTACVGTAVGVSQTYQPGRQSAITASGVLGVVQRNSTLLEDVGVRAQQVTPYLRNLLALSNALQEKYAAAPLDTPAVARILLVSDIHGGKQYSLMRTIVAEERIDAVVDSGDIVNFGRAEELDAAGIPQGIAALGVPYIFVRGNHDAAAPNDQAVLDRLAKIRNVVLLQPDATQYRVSTVHGVRIAGFNDPRWFGDTNTNTAAAQKPATEAFATAFGLSGAPAVSPDPPDIIVSHEPAAVRGLTTTGLLVNGHMHTPDLEGNRIQVGTFTGGGPFSHYLENTAGEELVGQPSAFDIAVFGGDCRLSALTRYTFRNVVEGRPAYDDVTLVNGARIEKTAPGPAGRTCSAASPVSVDTVPAAAAP